MKTARITSFLACTAMILVAWTVAIAAEPTGPQAPPAKDATVEVDSQIVSDYIWRGFNLLSNYNAQRGRADSATSGAYAFQPVIKFNTGLDGLYFSIFGSFALVGRKDMDIDNRVQRSPGGDFIGPGSSIYDPAFQANAGASIASYMPGPSQPISAYQNVPTFYKEPVGLQRNDEIDMTIGYEKETRVGVIGFGLIHYSFANSAGKGNPFFGCSGTAASGVANVDCGGGYFANEMFFTYALPSFKDLKFAFYSDLITSNQYYNLTYAHTWSLTKTTSLDSSFGAGYYVLPGLQGGSDVTARLGVKISGFKLGVNAVYRPDRRIQDYNFGYGDPITRLPINLNGYSTAYDSRTVDFSKMYGPANEYTNKLIAQTIQANLATPYTYIPRSAIAPLVFWLNFGYTFTI